MTTSNLRRIPVTYCDWLTSAWNCTSHIFPSGTSLPPTSFFFFLNNPAPPEISTLPLPDALPICRRLLVKSSSLANLPSTPAPRKATAPRSFGPPGPKLPSRFMKRSSHALRRNWGNRCKPARSEEHTSELQSPCNLVCRLLLEKKK